MGCDNFSRPRPNLLTRPVYFHYIFSFPVAQHPLVGQGLLIIEPSRSHPDTPHSVGFLWTSNRPNAEISASKHTTFTTDRHPGPRRGSNPQSQEASGRRSTPLESALYFISTTLFIQRSEKNGQVSVCTFTNILKLALLD